MLNEEINTNKLRNEYLLDNFDKNTKFEDEIKILQDEIDYCLNEIDIIKDDMYNNEKMYSCDNNNEQYSRSDDSYDYSQKNSI